MDNRLKELGIDRLTVEERLDLIEQIWNTLPEQVDPKDIPEWHFEEIDRRLARMKEHPEEGTPWSEVLAEMEKKYENHPED
jgi:putative addiction module component (TIGR02574 family)